MEKRVEPFTHSESLSPLDLNLILGKGSQQHKQCKGVEYGPVGPNAGNASAHFINKILLLDKEHVCSSVAKGKNGGALKDSFAVVESVNNSLVLLPLVCLHFLLFSFLI